MKLNLAQYSSTTHPQISLGFVKAHNSGLALYTKNLFARKKVFFYEISLIPFSSVTELTNIENLFILTIWSFGTELGNGSSLKGTFSINAVSGEITLNASLDREATGNIIFITLFASDFGSPPKTGSATLNVSVVDINDNIPKFSTDSYQITVTEVGIAWKYFFQMKILISLAFYLFSKLNLICIKVVQKYKWQIKKKNHYNKCFIAERKISIW